MKYVKVKCGSYLKGSIKIPPSKSLSHRAIIAASLAKGQSRIENLIQSKDIIATTNCMENLGASFIKEDTYTVSGSQPLLLKNKVFDCHESGSTLRFMIPIAMLVNEAVTFIGSGKLVSRPLDPYIDLFQEQNISYTHKGALPLKVEGSFKAGTYKIRGDISSQFITGLLYALPLVDGESIIEITTDLESKGYIDLTLDILEKFGVSIINNHYKQFIIKGNQHYSPTNYYVEGDFSQIAFWVVAGLIGGDIQCLDMNLDSKQGDIELLDIVKRMGGSITIGKSIDVKKSSTHHTIIDGSQCPDIIPVLAVLASVSTGTTEIINAGRLRIKECDRLRATAQELNKLGADVTEMENGLIIKGKESLKGGTVSGWNDHRIVMAMTVASLVCQEDVIIEGPDAITKSYPHFFEDFTMLGGSVNEWHMAK